MNKYIKMYEKKYKNVFSFKCKLSRHKNSRFFHFFPKINMIRVQFAYSVILVFMHHAFIIIFP